MPSFKIPVVRKTRGFYSIEADTYENAVSQAEKIAKENQPFDGNEDLMSVKLAKAGSVGKAVVNDDPAELRMAF